MEEYNLQRAIQIGKKPFLVVKDDRKRYVLASSYEQCSAKFTGWIVIEVSLEEFKKGK